MIGLMVGADVSGNALVELSTPIGSLTVAVIVLAYHGLALRADQAVVARAGAVEPAGAEPAGAEPAAATAVEGTVQVEGAPMTAIQLTLRVPAGADPGPIIAALHDALPAGTELATNDG